MGNDNSNASMSNSEDNSTEYRDNVDDYMVLLVYVDGRTDYHRICNVVNNSFIEFGDPMNEAIALRTLLDSDVRVVNVTLESIRTAIQERNANFLQELAGEFDASKRGIL